MIVILVAFLYMDYSVGGYITKLNLKGNGTQPLKSFDL
jgi:hypothetical protein